VSDGPSSHLHLLGDQALTVITGRFGCTPGEALMMLVRHAVISEVTPRELARDLADRSRQGEILEEMRELS
jgi:hypothetical protein